ncbi:MAG: KUP/HAK/KT family potassium transporter, partial [Myxococcales bacterium]|nr:KUP/HAK/KT family potassium transporter [Myxococcales bacterium]
MSQAVPEPPASTTHVHTAPKVSGPGDLAKLALGALGVVYGDIGTSPLYAMKECFEPGHGMDPSRANVLGVLSLFVWSLTLVVVVKYLSFIMRADNKGEGGILALLALLKPRRSEKPVIGLPILVLLGLFGSALLYGDGMITPAISVLSAVEGLGVATNKLDPVVVPITVIILIVLFVVQKRGTAGIGAVFGPAMLLWFVAIAAAGIPWVLRQPEVLRAVDPRYAINFMLHHKWHGFLVLGSVVLCITGGEALYADMGHFGKKPIRWAWYAVVLPALLCNYFGQAALYLANEGHPPEHPFYGLVSGWALYPMVGIATVATVVASQALISGAYSLTQQAVQLGYCPRVTIKHTSGSAEGQIYVPEVNNALMVACVTLVLVFQKSSNLAAAYGIAVTGTMSITSLLFSAVAVSRWKWRPVFVFMLVGGFMIIDLAFFGANVVKLKPSPEHPIQGGWFPLVVGAVIFTVMTTWKRGREALGDFIRSATLPLDMFMADVTATKPHRVKGTAVFMTSNPEGAPPVLLHHFK